jgi:hypothetical protein
LHQDFAVLRDTVGNARFYDSSDATIRVARYPWTLLEAQVPKSTPTFVSDRGEGRKVWRVHLAFSQWAVVQMLSGEIKFLPPVLENGVPCR